MSILIPAGTAEFKVSGFFSPSQPKPLAICGFFKFDQFSSPSFIASDMLAAGSGTTYLSARFYHDGSGNNYRRLSARIYDGGVGVNTNAALGTASDSADIWIPFVAVHTSNSLRTIYTLDGNSNVVTAENTGSYNLPDSQDLSIRGLSEADLRLFSPSFYINDLTAVQAEEFLRTGAIEGVTPYVAWDTDADWGTGDILDVSGNGRHITPPAAWQYSADGPEIGPQVTTGISVQPGDTLTLTITGFTSPPTDATISDGTNTIPLTSFTNTTGDTWTAVLTDVGDEISYVLYGEVTVEASNASESATTTTTLNPPTDWGQIALASGFANDQESFLYSYGGVPAVPDQFAYDPIDPATSSELTLNTNGYWTSTGDGTWTVYGTDATDGFMESFPLTSGDPPVDPPASTGKITRRNVTRRTLTRRSLTARP